MATVNVFCKQNCQQGSVICAIHVQYALFLLIKYKIINLVNIWDNLPKLYFLSFMRDKQGKKMYLMFNKREI